MWRNCRGSLQPLCTRSVQHSAHFRSGTYLAAVEHRLCNCLYSSHYNCKESIAIELGYRWFLGSLFQRPPRHHHPPPTPLVLAQCMAFLWCARQRGFQNCLRVIILKGARAMCSPCRQGSTCMRNLPEDVYMTSGAAACQRFLRCMRLKASNEMCCRRSLL